MCTIYLMPNVLQINVILKFPEFLQSVKKKDALM